jgi:exodeoxyribonuclease V gamma subunit
MRKPEPGLILYTSNRLEVLAQSLAEALREPLSSPFHPEVILVQSHGMQRWISMELARRHGIAANCRFPFPNTFVHELFSKILPSLPDRSPFDPDILTWSVMNLLPSCAKRAGFEILNAYLGDEKTGLKRYQLSQRIADLFDQYLLYRPHMVLGWEQGQDSHWQAKLWRQLIKKFGGKHRAALGRQLLQALHETAFSAAELPQRISVFGISTLPRFHLELLAAISRITQVNLFLMNPCKEYWGDIVSEKEWIRRTQTAGPESAAGEALHFEKGNRLLSSMGTQGRDFFDLINEFEYQELSRFEDPKGHDLLSCIQGDILNLRGEDPVHEKREISSTDTSICIHSCHSPMREMEVLHDQLLDMFETDEQLRPADVLVMTPDIEAYAPYIQAVFDLPPDNPGRIPFSIADRTIRKESLLADTFLALLDLQGSRFGATKILNLLESQPLRQRFGLTEKDLALVRKWILDTGIRWGINPQNRKDLGLPPFSENTWQEGLDRLLLGYAMPGRGEQLFCQIRPYDLLEGEDNQVLGRFLPFAEQVFQWVPELGQHRTLDQWAEHLARLLDTFFLPDDDSEREMQVIRNQLMELGTMQELGRFPEPVGLEVVKWHLAKSFEREGFGFGFLTGRVTFCAMLPMRSIPFKVVCLVGMNGDAYPRQSRRLGFDLMAQNPLPGDRSRRHDDRYLFLEAILSSRQRLYISYVGQDIRDNTPVVPSVLVSELMDYVHQEFFMSDLPILDRMVTPHRLQAFSPAYFSGKSELFSYSTDYLETSESLLKERSAPPPFFSEGLNQPDEEWRHVQLEDLCRFFRNPARFLVGKRLGMWGAWKEPILEDREPFEVKGLERFQMEQELLKKRLSGHEVPTLQEVTRASGRLPHGTVGDCVFEELGKGIEPFADQLEAYQAQPPLEPLDVDLHLSHFQLTGRILPVYAEGWVHYRYARLKPGDFLYAWIHHLALNSLGKRGYPRKSILAGLNPKGKERAWQAWQFVPMDHAHRMLEDLLEHYWNGLVRPLHFFPDSSWVYATATLLQHKNAKEALMRAGKTWQGSDFAGGECEDEAYALCFADQDPLDSEFESISRAILEPLLAHRSEM